MMMISKHQQRSILVFSATVLLVGSASAADRIETLEATFAAHHLEHTKFADLKESELTTADQLFLRDLFELMDEFVDVTDKEKTLMKLWNRFVHK